MSDVKYYIKRPMQIKAIKTVANMQLCNALVPSVLCDNRVFRFPIKYVSPATTATIKYLLLSFYVV